MTDLPDKVTVAGLGRRLDGEYRFDVGDMLGIGGPASLTGNEAQLIKQVSGVRAGELEENLIAGDWDTLLALAIVILARNDVRVTADQLRALPLSAIEFDFAVRQVLAEDDADDPPAMADAPPSANGGASSKPTSAPLVSVPPPTGHPASERSATYDRVTSAS